MSTEDPRCPECGGKIGQTATYCMHCQTDLSDDDGGWSDEDPPDEGGDPAATATDIADQIAEATADATGTATDDGSGSGTGSGSDGLLDPDGLVDNTLTAIVGVVGGIVVGIVGTIALAFLTASGYALLLGLVLWIGSTVYLVRRKTVQGAISRSAYAVSLVLLIVPFVSLSPVVTVDGGLEERLAGFVVLLLMVSIPALFSAGVGYVAGRYSPE